MIVITAAPSQSLAAELARLLPDLRALIGPDRACTVVFDRGGYSPAVFTQIIAAGFDVLTYFKGAWAHFGSEAFTTVGLLRDALLISLAANFANLLDRAPGRVNKVAHVSSVALAASRPVLPPSPCCPGPDR